MLFTVRVELHGAIPTDYTTLDQKLDAIGVHDYIVSGAGERFKMPGGSFAADLNTDSNKLCDQVFAIASSIKKWAKTPWVVVTQGASSFRLDKDERKPAVPQFKRT